MSRPEPERRGPHARDVPENTTRFGGAPLGGSPLTHADADEQPVSFLARPVPGWLGVRVVPIPPHSELTYKPSDWAGALVVVEADEIELECTTGGAPASALGLFSSSRASVCVPYATAQPRRHCLPQRPDAAAASRRGAASSRTGLRLGVAGSPPSRHEQKRRPGSSS